MKKNILNLAGIFAAAVLFSGCIKDKGYDNGDYQANRYSDQKIVSVALTTADNTNVTTTALNADTDLKTFALIPVAVTGPAETDVHVVLDTSSAIVTSYNTANSANLIPLTTNFTIVSKTITIPKGQTTGYVMVKFKPIDLLGPLYAVGIKIISVDNGYTIAGNGKNQGIAILTIKNRYDGVYTATGTFQDLSNPAFTGIYPYNLQLVTTGPNSFDVVVQNGPTFFPNYVFSNAGAGTFYGSFGLTATVDPVTNLFSDLHNYYGDPTKAATAGGTPATGTGAPLYAASNGRRATLDPSGENSFDPVTKTIKIKYFLVQPSVIPVGPRSLFNETWTYVGPRP